MRKMVVVAFAFVLCILVFTVVVSDYVVNNSQSMTKPWMFKGAYAKYDGQIDSVSMNYSLTAELLIMEVNASYIQLRTLSTILTPFTKALTDQTTIWINKNNISFQPEGETLARNYSTFITVKGIGLRESIIYEYINQAINVTYYLDKALLWPIRIVYVTEFENQTYNLEFNLSETNIPGCFLGNL